MRFRAGSLWVPTCLLAATSLIVGPRRPALAGSPTEAEAALKRGVELRRQGADGQALEEFRRAYRLVASSRAQAQIGLAEQALGRWADAEEHLTRALADGGDPWIQRNRITLERSRAVIGGHLGSLEVLGDPAGAELRVDGRLVGTLPLARPLRVAAGTVVIELRAGGYTPAARPVTVIAGELARETVSLQRVSPPTSLLPPPPPLPRLPPPPSSPSATSPGPATGRSDSAGAGRWQRPAAWVGLGGTALFAGGLVAALAARRHYDGIVVQRLFDGRCTQSGHAFSGPAAPECATAADAREEAQTLGLVSGGLAGAFAVASVILFVAALDAEAGAGTRQLACGVMADRSVACGVSF